MADRFYTPGGIVVGTNFQIGAEAPIDARFTVASKQGLDDADFKKYEGLISYVKDEKIYYQFVDGAWKPLSVKSAAELEEIIKGLIATETTGAMEFKGATASLPENPEKGDMWKVAGENINIVINEKAAKVGDTIIYNGEAWTLIPSGDDIEDTWRKIIAGGNELANDEALELIAGENVTIVEEGGKVTISSSYEDTHYESKLVVGNEATDAADESVVENGNVHLNLVEDGVVKSSHKIVGAGGITVKHATDENGNVITIEAPEGAKYDLAAKTENGEAILSLAGTDNTEDKVAIVGADAVSVSVVEGKVVITAPDTTYQGSEGAEVKVIVKDGAISAELVEVGLDKLAETIQTKLGYVDTGKSITTAISEAIAALSAENGAIYNIVKDNGTIDNKISAAIEELELDTTYVAEEGFDARVAAIEVNKAKEAGHATSADNASEATHATNADNAAEAVHASNADNASEATHAASADNATHAVNADKATNADNAAEAAHAAAADEATHAANADNATHATAAGKVDNTLSIKVGGATKIFDGSADIEADVDAAIKAAVDAIPEQIDYTVTCADQDYEATDGVPAFKRHTLTQNGKQVCVIDVPRDLVLKSGYVDAEKDELVLVLVNDEEVRVDVKHLIEYVTGATATDGIITVNVDDKFVATATINDGTITEAKLHSNVTAKLNKAWATTEQGDKADSALQSVKVLGKELTKSANEITVAEAKTALGLGTAAAKNVEDFLATEGPNGLEVTWNNPESDSSELNETGLRVAHTDHESGWCTVQTATGFIAHESGITKYGDGVIKREFDEFIGEEVGYKNHKVNIALPNQSGVLATEENTLASVVADTGLKVSAKADRSQTISIDTDVVFVLDCNW